MALTSFALATAAIGTLGTNFSSWFGSQNVTADITTPYYTEPLASPMSGAKIVSVTGATPITLDQVYGLTSTLSLTNKHFFIVKDATAATRAVMAFRLAGLWKFIAMDIADPTLWFSDPLYGNTILYSGRGFTG